MLLGAESQLTFLFQIDSTLRNHDWHVAVDVALALIVVQTDGDVGVSYTFLQRHTKYALRGCEFCWLESLQNKQTHIAKLSLLVVAIGPAPKSPLPTACGFLPIPPNHPVLRNQRKHTEAQNMLARYHTTHLAVLEPSYHSS